jgi:hypothetical protein
MWAKVSGAVPTLITMAELNLSFTADPEQTSSRRN